MAELELKSIVKTFGKVDVIHDMNLTVHDGELIVFVGPSGCGKSTLLRIIAGLESASDGEVWIGGRRIDHLPPSDRGIAMVFQSYALYPHKDVRGNLGFALKHAGVDRNEIDRRVNTAASILGLENMMDRKPRALSGGQRQRVAIGRAIVRKPDVFLFDEPLSNLDAALRVHMRIEILKLHQRLGNTLIYVTHDQIEAMTLADRIVVFREGRVEQVGTPLELYENPVNTFVAGFIGSPSMNLVNVGLQQGRIELAGQIIAETGSTAGDTDVIVGLRPEHLFLQDDGPLAGEVQVFEHLGGESYLHLLLPDNQTLVARLDGRHRFEPGQHCRLAIAPEHCHLFDLQGVRLAH